MHPVTKLKMATVLKEICELQILTCHAGSTVSFKKIYYMKGAVRKKKIEHVSEKGIFSQDFNKYC